MENPSNTSIQAQEGSHHHPSRPVGRKFDDGDDLELTPPPRISKRSRDPQGPDSRPEPSADCGNKEKATSIVKDEGIPEEFAWMDPDEYRAAVLAQQQLDEANRNKGAASNLSKSDENRPSTAPNLVDSDVMHKESLSPSLKSGHAFPHEVPWSLPRSEKDDLDKGKGSKGAPRVTSLCQKRMEDFFPQEVPWRTQRENAVEKALKQEKRKPVATFHLAHNWRAAYTADREDLSLEPQLMHGAVAVSGPGGYYPSYESAVPSGSPQNEDGLSDVLLSAVVVPNEQPHPPQLTPTPPGEGLPYAEATVVPYKRRRRIAFGLVLLIVIGLILALVLALRGSDDPRYRVLLSVVFRLDSNPQETGWTLECSSHTVIQVDPGFYKHPNVTSISVVEVVDGDNCTLTVIDTGGDGIDEGFFEVYLGDITDEDEDPALSLVFMSGNFTNETSGTFTAEGTSEPVVGQTSLPTTPTPTAAPSPPPTLQPPVEPTLAPTPTRPESTPPPTPPPAPGPEPTPPPTPDCLSGECCSDDDCKGDEECSGNHECVCPYECCSDDDCKSDEECPGNHECVCRYECCSDDDCKSDEECSGNHECDCRYECCSDDDCKSDEECSGNHECVCRYECCSDGHCENYEECSSNHECITVGCISDNDCSGTDTCVDMECVPVCEIYDCCSDRDCPKGYVCQPPGDCVCECSTDSDCPGTETCINNCECVPVCEIYDCCSDRDCSPGYFCRDPGDCVPVPG